MTTGWLSRIACGARAAHKSQTPKGIPVTLSISAPPEGSPASDLDGLLLRLEHARLRLLRGFEELLCLEGLSGVEHLPHQIETVRKVLRHFRGRVLLADEVGLGKTIEACLLLREFLLRGMAKRVLILVPPPLVAQWQEELHSKFNLAFVTADSPPTDFWAENDRVLASLSLAKSRRHFAAVTASAWDLVIVDEAHHCKNRNTRNWQLVNALQRRHLFLLSATPVQNDLLELYNLLTLLEPGHLKTEKDFRQRFIRRGNPRDPRNRERLRELLGEVMIRNTRSLVSIHLPKRYAHTCVVAPGPEEQRFQLLLDSYLRSRQSPAVQPPAAVDPDEAPLFQPEQERPGETRKEAGGTGRIEPLASVRIQALLRSAGSHWAAVAPLLERIAREDPLARPLLDLVPRLGRSAKEEKLLELLRQNARAKTLIFANYRATLDRLEETLLGAGIPYGVFSGAQSAAEKARVVEEFRSALPVMLCAESGGEGQNLQFCNTLVNFDLPWNPMQIEQRAGRIHRIGQTREVFLFNLCSSGSMEARILRLLNDKLRMFELVVGEVGSILGNLAEGEEFESLVLRAWFKSSDPKTLDDEFDQLGESLLQAQEQYLQSKELDEALFGDDFE